MNSSTHQAQHCGSPSPRASRQGPMINGIHLTLLVGPAVPVPAPTAVVDALTSVQVTSSTDRSGFQLQFSVGKNSILQTTLLPSGYFDPIITRVIVVATVRGLPHVL